VVLVWAGNAKLLAKVVDVLNRDLKEPAKRVYKKTTYFRRVDEKGSVTFYYVAGSFLAFSSQEAMLREVLARRLDRSGREKGKEAPLVQQLRRLGVDRALAVLWFNPRAFDAHIGKIVAGARAAEAPALKTFRRYWRAVEGAALALSVGNNVAVKFAVRASADKLPREAQPLFAKATEPSDLWQRFPADALVAGAGRIDFVAFVRSLGELLPPQAREAFKAGLKRGVEAPFGVDLFKDILPYLGPDWGFCVTAPADKKTLIPYFTWALRVQPGPKKMSVGQVLFSGLNTVAQFAVLSYNSGPGPGAMELKSAKQGDDEVKYLVNEKLFPRGFQPAFALKDGYLLLATSPEAVRTFAKGTTARKVSGEVPVLRVSLRGWATFLKDRRAAVTKYLAKKDGISRDKARQHLEGLVWALDLFDRLELTQKTGGGLARWTLTLHPSRPAKKD
jgi:hypothetical protein